MEKTVKQIIADEQKIIAQRAEIKELRRQITNLRDKVKYLKSKKYIRNLPAEIWIKYDPEDPIAMDLKKELAAEFEQDGGFIYSDARRMPDRHYDTFLYFWILKRRGDRRLKRSKG